ncbi:MAG: hypothetical protein QM523_06585 [Candidatus Pacebacteria bacterium]|nr:hypothetical protein [Candidatus Paceibacterota bacterium]
MAAVIGFGLWGYFIYHQPSAHAETSAEATKAENEAKYTDLKTIKATHGLVKRSGATLELTIANGKNISLTDGGGCEEEDVDTCYSYGFIEHNKKLKAYLVFNRFWEGYQFLWINQVTGKTTELGDTPHLSPSGQRAILVNNVDPGFGFMGIEIWKLESGDPVLEWRYQSGCESECNSYSFGKWLDEDRVELIQEVEDHNYHYLYRPVGKVVLVRQPKWHIESQKQ